ncbi:MAG: hypothetical protein VR67_03225 [Peptococcaceae bacterium BRH_c8a]|nr:MAG: hypothetical protein VR67_03225 [Peptococcaceae bacterium BRH_c8a]
MNNTQKKLLYTFLPMTVIIILLDILSHGDIKVGYVKYATIITLFLATLVVRKRYQEQKIMNIAVFFIIVGDFFLVFCDTFPEISGKVHIFGIFGFLVAYLFLILAFHKNFRVGWKELFAGIPVLAIFIPNYFILFPYVSGLMFYGGTLFSVILCYMAWVSICTMLRCYYSPRISRCIALAGYLMLICDIGVSQSLFNPAFANQFNPWLACLIWGSYVPAWTLIAVTIAEDNLLYDTNKLLFQRVYCLKEPD